MIAKKKMMKKDSPNADQYYAHLSRVALWETVEKVII